MTKEQKAEAYSMRQDGASFQEIAKHFGLSKQHIQRSIPAVSGFGDAVKPIQGCIYPNIERWRRRNRLSAAEFGRIIGVTPFTVIRMMKGTTQPLKPMIDGILKLTGMTCEVAFATTETSPIYNRKE